MGPLIAALEKVDSQVKQAVKEGARLLPVSQLTARASSTNQQSDHVKQDGSYPRRNLQSSSTVMTFKTLEEAVDMCNDSTMGLTLVSLPRA